MISSQHQRIKFSQETNVDILGASAKLRECALKGNCETFRRSLCRLGLFSIQTSSVPLHSLVSRANNNVKFLLLSHQTDYLLLCQVNCLQAKDQSEIGRIITLCVDPLAWFHCIKTRWENAIYYVLGSRHFKAEIQFANEIRPCRVNQTQALNVVVRNFRHPSECFE